MIGGAPYFKKHPVGFQTFSHVNITNKATKTVGYVTFNPIANYCSSWWFRTNVVFQVIFLDKKEHLSCCLAGQPTLSEVVNGIPSCSCDLHDSWKILILRSPQILMENHELFVIKLRVVYWYASVLSQFFVILGVWSNPFPWPQDAKSGFQRHMTLQAKRPGQWLWKPWLALDANGFVLQPWWELWRLEWLPHLTALRFVGAWVIFCTMMWPTHFSWAALGQPPGSRHGSSQQLRAGMQLGSHSQLPNSCAVWGM